MENLQALLNLMKTLRRDCGWSKEQTFESIAPYTIEEAYEVDDAIRNKNYSALKDELGDLLFQIVFHAEMAAELGLFDFEDLAASITEKIIRRSPHLFDGGAAKSADEVDCEWQKIKARERAENKARQDSVLDDVTLALPALLRAEKLTRRAASIGFEWHYEAQCMEKFDEELAELKEALNENDADHIEEEFGDVLMTLCNWARFKGVHPEAALQKANQKFIERFQSLETLLTEKQSDLSALTLDQAINLWHEAKARLKSQKTDRGKAA